MCGCSIIFEINKGQAFTMEDQKNNPPAIHHEQAIVIGGGIAGLLAAHSLSPAFEHVTLIDRDSLLDGTQPRKGAPQSMHVHVLLRKGMLLLEEFFPGFGADLAAAGAPHVDWTQDLALFTRGGWAPRFESGLCTYTCSRGMLEYQIRRRVAALPNVEICEKDEVTGLVFEAKNRVTGVSMRRRGGANPGSDGQELTAGLVVDASGRSSRVTQWLQTTGHALPEAIEVDASLGYASRTYRKPASFDDRWKVLMIRDRPPFGTRAGVIFPIEGDQWIANLGGAGGDFPPTDEDGFLQFARELINLEFYDALKGAEPVSSIAGYRRTANRLNRFELMESWPEGLLAVGDSVCAFNPVYGQGMTVAALEAQALSAWLKKAATCRSFQQSLAAILRTPWLMATNEDRRIVEDASLPRSPMDTFMRRYFDEVQWLAGYDREAFHAFLSVSHLAKSPASLFHPRIALKVIRLMLSKR